MEESVMGLRWTSQGRASLRRSKHRKGKGKTLGRSSFLAPNGRTQRLLWLAQSAGGRVGDKARDWAGKPTR